MASLNMKIVSGPDGVPDGAINAWTRVNIKDVYLSDFILRSYFLILKYKGI